jgi:hypothetical protein
VTGSFGSRAANGLDCFQVAFCEMFEALLYFASETAYKRQRRVAKRSEDLRRMTCMGACLVFAASDVAHVMEAVLGTSYKEPLMI